MSPIKLSPLGFRILQFFYGPGLQYDIHRSGLTSCGLLGGIVSQFLLGLFLSVIAGVAVSIVISLVVFGFVVSSEGWESMMILTQEHSLLGSLTGFGLVSSGLVGMFTVVGAAYAVVIHGVGFVVEIKDQTGIGEVVKSWKDKVCRKIELMD